MTAVPVIELNQKDLLSAIEGAGLGLWTWELEKDVLTANDNWYYMLGYSPGDFSLSMATWTSMMHPEDAEIFQEKLKYHIQSGSGFKLRIRIKNAIGDWFWTMWSGRPSALSATGKITSMFGMTTDIHFLKLSEMLLMKKQQQYEQSENLLRNILEDQTEFIRRTTAAGQTTFVNKAYCNFFGITQEWFENHEATELFHPDDLKTNYPDPFSLTVTQPLHTFRLRTREENNAPRWIEWTRRAFFDAEQKLVGFQSVGRDITENMRLEMELIKSNELLEERIRERTAQIHENTQFLESVLRGFGAGIIVVRADSGKIVEMNARAQEILGCTAEYFHGKHAADLPGLVSPHDRRVVPLLAADVTDNYAEGVLNQIDGSVLSVSRTQIEIVRNGEPNIVALLFDISMRKALEAQLGMAQKLESVGRLASGIAHEINTPIQYVGDNLRFLNDSWQDLSKIITLAKNLQEELHSVPAPQLCSKLQDAIDSVDVDFLVSEVPQAIAQALDGADRVATIVRAMKRFAHPGGDQMSAVDLNKALETTALVAKNEWKYVAKLQLDLDSDLPSVFCLANDMNQVFLNIIVNAAHAIAERQEKEQSEEQGTIHVKTVREGEWVHVSIGDTGCGIPKEHRDKIFDQFFTTKEVGKGTGQGLAIAHDVIVGKHGGRIDVDSEPGQGSTFTLSIPLGHSPAVQTEFWD